MGVYKKIETLLLIPFIVVSTLACIKYTPGTMFESAESFQLGYGYAYVFYFIGAIPIKTIVCLVNRYNNKTWVWPIGFRYFIIPILLFLWLEYYVPSL